MPIKTYDHQLVVLPSIVTPNDHYYIKATGTNFILHYIGGDDGVPVMVGVEGRIVYHHVQGVPNTIWTIPHNLKYNPPAVMVLDSSNRQIFGANVNYIDINNLTLTFDAGFGGDAYLG